MAAHPHRLPVGRRSRRVATALIAGLAAMSGMLAIPGASAAPSDALGPEVVRTNEGPTGYEVTFRYEAPPDVGSVQIYGEWWFSQPESVTCQGCSDDRTGAEWQPGDIPSGPWKTLEMVRGDDGVWTYTMPLPSGTFRYAFAHECTSETASGCTLRPDPANPLEVVPHPGAEGALLSRVYVPGHPRFRTYDNDYQKPVSPRWAGTLEERRYESPLSTNPVGEHDLVVYLPHGYDPERSTLYPTLYISHGGGGNATDWTMEGVAQHILENAIRAGDAQPMVVVSTDFYGLPGGNQGYADELRDNVIPFVEENYNVSTRSEDRAFAGLSAGGGRAITILYDNTDLVGYHAAWSAGGDASDDVPAAEQVDRMRGLPGIHMGTGLQDHQSDIAVRSQARVALLEGLGVDVAEHNVDGTHVWDVWRQLLNDYLKTVAFRTTTTELDVDTSAAGVSGGTRVTATADVSAVSTSIKAPSGRVAFYAGDDYLGSARVGADGVARLRTVVRELDDPIVARYEGDDLFNASDGAPVEVAG